MIVAEAVGRALAARGVEAVFGVVGSGNFHVTNALVAAGARFVAARHEGGAATMADAYARMSGRAGVLSVHQGPGLTNALTGIAEAAKSRTPLVVLAGEATDRRSNFHIDQDALVAAVGAVAMRVTSGEEAWERAEEAYRVAVEERRTVLLSLPLDVQSQPCPAAPTAGSGPAARSVSGSGPTAGGSGPTAGGPGATATGSGSGARAAVGGFGPAAWSAAGGDEADLPLPAEVDALARLLAEASRPVFIAGRGARHARRELEALAERTGALLATSAVARGLFRGSPWDLDVSGGFATPLAAELITGADLVVGWGCALNMWTTRHGSLLPAAGQVVQVDLDPAAIGVHVPVDLGVTGDTAAVASALTGLVPAAAGYRSAALESRIRAEGRWRAVPYEDQGDGGRIDPRTLTIGLDDLLPAERVVAVDSGNFMGYPSMFLDVPDENGFCFTQAFQSVGLGLATAIGAAVARPDRLPVAALGDGGALMGAAELETVVRLGLPMVVVVYDDEAYGAEVHHFGPHGHPLDTVTFPPADLAAIARGHGFAAVTVTREGDLGGVAEWLKGPRDRPLLVHAKVTRDRGSWWLEEAFKGH
ncbi:thiamine pyrophosphate-binding protein [Nonomuraea wenchangensis]|uniref:Acetolactate synthase large subunit n=1 Tax=Nonomuraea wenchangensis TaxID=568860 RepID=A0A1H9Z160_9ACTN|nr:thiamine pyrophosphate-binding protein [Nonomuraea wenchangensis]SES75115.1 Acetolactate synthase large subunit [Nonomuraea wenchangensis]